MDHEQLAGQVVGLVASFCRQAGDPASADAPALPGAALYALVEERMVGSDLGQAVLSRLGARPDDAALTGALRVAVREALDDDSAFATALETEVQRYQRDFPELAQASVATGNHVTVGTMRKSQFSLGSITNSRRTRISLGIGIPVAIVLLVLLARAVSGPGEAAVGPVSDLAETGSQGTSPGAPGFASLQDFCSTMGRLGVLLNEHGFGDSEGDSSQMVLDAIEDVNPPAEILDDWETTVAVTEAVVNDESFDPSEAEGEATERVRDYVGIHCGILLGS